MRSAAGNRWWSSPARSASARRSSAAPCCSGSIGNTFVSVINNPLLERDDLLKQMLQDFGVISTDRTVVQDDDPPRSGPRAGGLSRLAHRARRPRRRHDRRGAAHSAGRARANPPAVEHRRAERHAAADHAGRPAGAGIAASSVPSSGSSSSGCPGASVSNRWARTSFGSYIEHRLAVGRAAGSGLPGAAELAQALAEWNGDGTRVTFTPEAVQAVWRASGGLPRLVNLLCDRALESAYHRQLRTIDAGLIEKARDRSSSACDVSVGALVFLTSAASAAAIAVVAATLARRFDVATPRERYGDGSVPLELASPSTAARRPWPD